MNNSLYNFSEQHYVYFLKKKQKERKRKNKVSSLFQNGANAPLKLNFIIYWQSRWQEIK